MTAALPLLLGLAVVVAVVRLVVGWSRAPADGRAAPWRLALLLAAQPICAGLLYLALLPPAARPAGTLVVATRDAGAATGLAGDPVVALPEAPAVAGAERVPDLATALRRRHPSRVRIVGAGLTPRDIDAARGLAIDFAPSPPPVGLVRLDPPGTVAAGGKFTLGGRVAGVAEAKVVLIDPAGSLVDSAVPDAAGDFVVTGTARAAGPATFVVRVVTGTRTIDAAQVPVMTTAAAAQRLMLLPGAPGPEVKFLRRWADAAGLAVHSQLPTGAGVDLGDAALPLTAATLARFDVAVIDVRRWQALGPGERGAVIAAVRAGLGLVIRLDGPLTDAARAALRPLGFVVGGGDETAPFVLASPAIDDAARLARDGPGSRDAPTLLARDAVPPLARWTAVAGTGATPLLRDAPGATVAAWRAAGEGRIALWPLADSYRLVLTGYGATYGELWSEALATVGRGERRVIVRVGQPAWVGQRVAICGAGQPAQVVAPDGRATALLDDGGCAAFWPRVAGWYRVRAGGHDVGAPFAVIPAAALPGVRAQLDRDATLALAAAAPAPRGVMGSQLPIGGSWLWAAAWLVVSGALWWFERSRFGTARRPDGKRDEARESLAAVDGSR